MCFLNRTGQTWKLRWAGAGLLTLFVLSIGVRFDGIDVLSWTQAWLLVAITSVGCASVFGIAATIRCPTCRTQLLWKAMREQSVIRWLDWLLSLRRCPVCGSDGKEALSSPW